MTKPKPRCLKCGHRKHNGSCPLLELPPGGLSENDIYRLIDNLRAEAEK